MILKPITTESWLYRLTEQGYDMIFVKDGNYQFEVIRSNLRVVWFRWYNIHNSIRTQRTIRELFEKPFNSC